MRRGVFAVIGTIAGTALLVGAKLGTRPPLDPNAVAAVGGTSTATTAGGSPPPAGAAPAPGGTTTHPGSAHPTAPTSARPTRTAGKPAPTGGGTRTTSPPTQPAGTGLKNGTFTGAGASERYGTVTVTITVSGGRMTNVSASYSASSSTSQQISNAAFPTLKQEALSAQSASIASVSGATYTSSAYKVSLQSALDKAKA